MCETKPNACYGTVMYSAQHGGMWGASISYYPEPARQEEEFLASLGYQYGTKVDAENACRAIAASAFPWAMNTGYDVEGFVGP